MKMTVIPIGMVPKGFEEQIEGSRDQRKNQELPDNNTAKIIYNILKNPIVM